VVTYNLMVVNRLTVVNNRLLLTEVREGGELRDAILLREPLVVDLDEVYAERVCVIVDLLQLFQYFVARDATSRIWRVTNMTLENAWCRKRTMSDLALPLHLLKNC
jgi:hypothetical protein